MQELAGHPGIPNTEAGLRRVVDAAVVAAAGSGHIPGTACDVTRTAAWPHGWCRTHARAVANTDVCAWCGAPVPPGAFACTGPCDYSTGAG